MATVSGITVTKAEEIENASIVSGSIVDGHLFLTTRGGATSDAGVIVPYRVALEDQGGETLTISSTSQTNYTGTESNDIPGLSIAVANPGTAIYMVTLDLDLIIATASEPAFEDLMFLLTVDDAPYGRWIRFTHLPDTIWPTGTRVPLSGNWLVTGLAAGAHTFKARAIRQAGSSAGLSHLGDQGAYMTVNGFEL